MGHPPLARDRTVQIPTAKGRLIGSLVVPERASGIVVFAHGSGSGRLSPRNQAVADSLHDSGLGTLLFDLLTESEARDRANVFDIALLGDRLITTLDWLAVQPETRGLSMGCFGASTGAAAALCAAAQRPASVHAVVSRGGRPDLAGSWLGDVRAPTLLIVGSRDEPVLGLNRMALQRLTCPKRLVVVPGATHLFEEAGTLEEVGRLAGDWFTQYLRSREMATR
jgi:pimeloyl-ACP methyl ester carboxylesterase